MNEKIPDKWCVVKINNNSDVLYKVFGCWYGGYGGSDSWRMNSGIENIKKQDDCWLFEGYSGSTYKCYKGYYGVHNYGLGILNDIIERSEHNGVKVDILPKDTNWVDLNYE